MSNIKPYHEIIREKYVNMYGEKTIVIYHKCGMNNRWYYLYVAMKKEGVFFNIKNILEINKIYHQTSYYIDHNFIELDDLGYKKFICAIQKEKYNIFVLENNKVIEMYKPVIIYDYDSDDENPK